MRSSSRDERGPAREPPPARPDRRERDGPGRLQDAVGNGGTLALLRQLRGGSALDAATKRRMERAFGQRFGDVRVHTGADAAAVASGERAHAVTVGRDIAFAAGAYRPGAPRGDALIAHELAHVVQQRDGAAQPMAKDDQAAATPLERDADDAAAGAVATLWAGAPAAAAPRLRSGPRVARAAVYDDPLSPFGRFTVGTNVVHQPLPLIPGKYQIKIDFAPRTDRTSRADQIKFLQVVRRTDAAGGHDTDAPDKALRTEPGGWRVDQRMGGAGTEPYYGQGTGLGVSTAGERLGDTWAPEPAMEDGPNIAWNARFEALSCAVCSKASAGAPDELGRSYGCISWGFAHGPGGLVEDPQLLTFQSPYGPQGGRAAGMASAVQQWNTAVVPATGAQAAPQPFARGAYVRADRTLVEPRVRGSDGKLARSSLFATGGQQVMVLRGERLDDLDGVNKEMVEVWYHDLAGGAQTGWLPADDLATDLRAAPPGTVFVPP